MKIGKTFLGASLLTILVCGCGKSYLSKYTNADESKFIEIQSDNQIYVLAGRGLPGEIKTYCIQTISETIKQ